MFNCFFPFSSLKSNSIGIIHSHMSHKYCDSWKGINCQDWCRRRISTHFAHSIQLNQIKSNQIKSTRVFVRLPSVDVCMKTTKYFESNWKLQNYTLATRIYRLIQVFVPQTESDLNQHAYSSYTYISDVSLRIEAEKRHSINIFNRIEIRGFFSHLNYLCLCYCSYVPFDIFLWLHFAGCLFFSIIFHIRNIYTLCRPYWIFSRKCDLFLRRFIDRTSFCPYVTLNK